MDETPEEKQARRDRLDEEMSRKRDLEDFKELLRLRKENAALRARVARLENLAKVVENYLEGDSDAEYLYVALKALEVGGEGGE